MILSWSARTKNQFIYCLQFIIKLYPKYPKAITLHPELTKLIKQAGLDHLYFIQCDEGQSPLKKFIVINPTQLTNPIQIDFSNKILLLSQSQEELLFFSYLKLHNFYQVFLRSLVIIQQILLVFFYFYIYSDEFIKINNFYKLIQLFKFNILIYVLKLYYLFLNIMFSSLKLTSFSIIGRQQQKKLTLILSNFLEAPQAADFVNPVDWEDLELHDYPLIVKHPMNLLKIQDRLKNKQYRAVQQVLDHIQLIWDNCKAYNPEGHYYILADKMQRQFKKMIKNYLPNIQVVVPKPYGSSSNNASYQLVAPQTIEKPAPSQGIKISSKPSRNTTHVHSYNIQSKDTPFQEAHSLNERVQQIVQVQQIPQTQKNRFHQRLKQLTQQQLAQIIALIQQNCAEGFKQLGGGRSQIHVDNIDIENFRKLNSKVDDLLDGEKNASKKVKI